MIRCYNYGIDLGTTNSCVARTTISDVIIFQNQDNMKVTPSAVYINKDGQLYTGVRALDKKIIEPYNTSTEFKRFMGVKHKEKFRDANKEMTPIELSAEILKSIREDVLTQTTLPLEDAVITVPASFDSRQCNATVKAAEMAGIKNTILLQEPIAATIAYGMKPNSKNQNWLVYDFGGGTLDVAVVSTYDNELCVFAHEGNNRLGGKDIDNLLVKNILFPAIKNKYNISENSTNFNNLFKRLSVIAESSKKALSSNEEYIADIYDIGLDADKKVIELSVNITRKMLEELIEPIINESIEICEKAISEACLVPSQLSKIILVGGTTYIPYIREKLKSEFKLPLDLSLDPMTVVARGAAIYGSGVQVRAIESVKELHDDSECIAKIEYPLVTDKINEEIVGKITNAKLSDLCEIKIDDVSGLWTSGWIPFVNEEKGIFDARVLLRENFLNFYKLSARNSDGNIVYIKNNTFTIRHDENSLRPASPPLPHSILIEKNENGVTSGIVMIKKGEPLPAKNIRKFYANKTLYPGSKDFIAIKIWEGENKSITSNEWIGNIYIRGESIKSIIPEGFEIEIEISIDESRRIDVSVMVPQLELVINDDFMYNCEPVCLHEPIAIIGRELPILIKRLVENRYIDESSRSQLLSLVDQLKDIENEFKICRELVGTDDERVMTLIDNFRKIKDLVFAYEKMAEQNDPEGKEIADIARIEKAFDMYGNNDDYNKYMTLKLEYLKCHEDEKLKKEIMNKMIYLKTNVMLNNREFLRLALKHLTLSTCAYSNASEAKEWKDIGRKALEASDIEGLQNAVVGLLNLSVDYNSDIFSQRTIPSDLR